MASFIHIAEIAGLLFAAYVLGWIVGYLARRISAPRAKPAQAPATAVAAAKTEAAEAPLVAAPEIVAVTAAKPFVAAVTPEPANASTALADLSAQKPFAPPPASAPLSGTTKAPVKIPAIFDVPLAKMPEALAPAPKPGVPVAAPVEPVPEVFVPEPSPAKTPRQLAMPANLAGQAWAGEIQGHEAPRYEPPAPKPALEQPPAFEPEATVVPADVQADLAAAVGGAPKSTELPPVEAQFPGPVVTEPAAPTPAPEVAPLVEAVRQAEAAVAEALAQATAVVDAIAATPEPPSVASVQEPAQPLAEPPMPVAAVDPTPPQAPEPIAQPTPPPPTARVEYDEDAAMRAIEGGWSRRASRALPDTPELSDVSAAVAAAQVAVEQVLVQSGVEATVDTRTSGFGKPRGLARPRDGQRDDLKLIRGVSPLDEATLNNLGIYHFDQVAIWDQKEVLWLENHAFARGRIVRETWQDQARTLAGDRGTLRVAR